MDCRVPVRNQLFNLPEKVHDLLQNAPKGGTLISKASLTPHN
jgi:hypothetical protein